MTEINNQPNQTLPTSSNMHTAITIIKFTNIYNNQKLNIKFSRISINKKCNSNFTLENV